MPTDLRSRWWWFRMRHRITRNLRRHGLEPVTLPEWEAIGRRLRNNAPSKRGPA